jgi:site-specific DNA-cytosine methylase
MSQLAGVAEVLATPYDAPSDPIGRRSRRAGLLWVRTLHSFPDWFEFHETLWHAFRQIGNSVPPRLARAVAGQVAVALRKEGRDAA